jgi:hypothetical protein
MIAPKRLAQGVHLTYATKHEIGQHLDYDSIVLDLLYVTTCAHYTRRL